MIPLFKSHYSLLKSILTLNPVGKEHDKDTSDSIIQIASESNLPSVVLVEDTMSAYLPASIACKSAGKKLIYGYRVSFVSDVKDKTETSMLSCHKNIIFPKNKKGYDDLIKISTIAAVDNFYKEPRLSYEDLHSNWSDDLVLSVPFYDSFLHKNSLNGSLCVPDLGKIKPTVFIESNDLPFDYLIEQSALEFAKSLDLNVQKVKSIYYKNRDDFEAYMTLKCLNRKAFGSGRTLSCPNFDHLSSREFSWESFLEQRA